MKGYPKLTWEGKVGKNPYDQPTPSTGLAVSRMCLLDKSEQTHIKIFTEQENLDTGSGLYEGGGRIDLRRELREVAHAKSPIRHWEIQYMLGYIGIGELVRPSQHSQQREFQPIILFSITSVSNHSSRLKNLALADTKIR